MSTSQSFRRILLVDTDRNFQRLLTEQIGPYGFEVVNASPADPDVLTKVTQLDPALLIIAVDEPDKVGYSLCNKAKKGVAANLPVILATSTIPPEGFANHRRLKIHADEYIDKRGLNPAEVVGKIDNLVGLGEMVAPPHDSGDDMLQIPVEVDDLPLDLADAEVVEQLDDGNDLVNEFESEGGHTAIAPPRVTDALLDQDLDGAFAAITDFADEAPPARAARKSEPPPPLPSTPPTRSSQVSLPPVEELELAEPASARHHGAAVETSPSDYVTDEASMGIPEPIAHDASDRDDLEAEEVQGDWQGEVPEPIGDLGEDFGGDERTSAGGPPLADLVNLGGAAAPVGDAELELPSAPDATQVVAEPAPAPVEAAPAPPAEPPGLDLGLEEVAARADAEQSGVHDRRTLQKIHLLERDNVRLKAELEKARAGDQTKSQGREREFLHLREMIAGKDKEILELRDELVAKDRQLLDGKEKLRTFQHTKAQLEAKNLELEQRIVGDSERVEQADAQRKELEVRGADLAARLAAAEQKVKADAEAAQRALAERTQQATMLDRELAAARQRLAEAEQRHAEALAATARAREGAEAQLREEGERLRAEAIEAARAEATAAQARALEEADARHAAALAEREQAAAGAVAAASQAAEQRLAEAAARHAAELEAARTDAENAVAAERARAEQAVAAEQARAEQAIGAERARADQAVADAATHVQEVAAAERAKAERAVADAQARAQEDMLQLVTTHQQEAEKAKAEHDAAVAALRRELDERLAAARAAAIADRDRLIAEHGAAISVLTEDRDKVQAELDGVRVEAEALRGEKAELDRGLSSARHQLQTLQQELVQARAQIADAIAERDRELAARDAAIAERDQRIAQVKADLDALEQENAGYQEQVLKAYQKIKADEATVARAKKAMAIALTLLDEEKGSEKTPG